MFAFWVGLFLAIPTQTLAQRNFHAYPDEGKLTPSVTLNDYSGKLEIMASSLIERKFAESGHPEFRLRALVEVLIYRKFTIEYLLKARDRMRFLGTALGMRPSLALMAPPELVAAFESSFPQQDFPEIGQTYKRALTPTVSAPRLSPLETRGFWISLIDQSLRVIQNQIEYAHAQETIHDAQAALAGGSDEAYWARFAEQSADDLTSSPILTPENAPNEALRLRAEQNQRIHELLNEAENYTGERLLYTPLNYEREFKTDAFLSSTLKELNSIKKHPTHDGILANVIAAIVLQDLQQQNLFSWRNSSSTNPRSGLLSHDLTNLPLDRISDSVFPLIQSAFRDAIETALMYNQEALLYLLQLDNQSILQTITGQKDWAKPRQEPDDPNITLMKFIDLLPFFWKSPTLMEKVENIYPLGDRNREEFREFLMNVYQKRQEQLQYRRDRIGIYNTVTLLAFAGSGFFGRLSGRALTIAFAISHAAIMATYIHPERAYRRDMANLTKALFMNTESDWSFSITPDRLHEVQVLDHQSGHDLIMAHVGLAAAGLWVSPLAWTKMAQPAFTSLARLWKSSTPSGNMIVQHARLQITKVQFYRFLKMMEKYFPDQYSEMMVHRHFNLPFGKIRKYFPDELIESEVPELATSLRALAERNGIAGAQERPLLELREELLTILRGIGDWYSKSKGPPDPAARLWHASLRAGFVDEVLDYSEFSQVVASKGEAYRANAANSILNRTFPNAVRESMDELSAALERNPHMVAEDIGQLRKQIKDGNSFMDIIRATQIQFRLIKFDDMQSKWVLKTVSALASVEENVVFGIGIRALRRFLIGSAYKTKILPLSALSNTSFMSFLKAKVERMGADDVRVALEQAKAVAKSASAEDATRSFAGRLWRSFKRSDNPLAIHLRGDKKWTKADAAVERWARNLGYKFRGEEWYVDQHTVSRWYHQAVLIGVPINVFGDRLARFDEKIWKKEFWTKENLGDGLRQEWDQTWINILVGLPQTFFEVPVSTMNISFSQRMRYSMGIGWATNIVFSFGANALLLASKGDPVFDSLFNVDCLMRLIHRAHFGSFYKATYSAIRSRAFWITRNVVQHPNFGTVNMRSASTIAVMSFLDKSIAGGTAWAWAAGDPLGLPIHATGSCDPFQDSFKTELEKNRVLLDLGASDFTLSQAKQGDLAYLDAVRNRTGIPSVEEFSLEDLLDPSEVETTQALDRTMQFLDRVYEPMIEAMEKNGNEG